MGRPLNKKFFANTNAVGVGGEGVASVAAVTGLVGMVAGGPFTILAADITAPQITGGAKPVLTFTALSTTTGSVSVVSAGSGYTAAPTVTVRGSLAGGSTTVTPTATLSASRVNGIKCETQFAAGDTEITTGDVVKQQGSRRYKVQTSQGTGFFTLVTTEAKAAGEMSIKATDSDGNTYFVAKLTSRKVLLVPAANVHGGTTTIGSQFASGASAKWTFGSAVANTTVTIDNQ